jgi:acyl transferase domain-containing protein
LAQSYRDLLLGGGDALADICFTAAVGRNHLDYRLALIAKTARDAADALTAYLQAGSGPNVFSGRRPLSGTPKLAFVFPGEGSLAWEQVLPMASRLLGRERAFCQAFDGCDALFQKHGHPPLAEALTRAASESLPILFSVQIALAALWRDWGIQPDAVMGLGLGEVAAANVADALSLEDAVHLVHDRSRFIQGLEGEISPKPGSLPMYSTVTARLCEGAELDASYWERNLTQPVDLASAVKALVSDDFRVFLEIGPGSVFSGTIRQALNVIGEPGTVVSSPADSMVERQALLGPLAQLYCLGYSPHWRRVYPKGRVVSHLPSYPWQHQRYWIDVKTKSSPRRPNGKTHPLLGHSMPSSAARPDCVFWEKDVVPQSRPYPGFQIVGGQRVVSSATFVHLALAAAKEVLTDDCPTISGLELHRPLVFSDAEPSVVQVSVSPNEVGNHVFHVHSRLGDSPRADPEWVLHATARLARG